MKTTTSFFARHIARYSYQLLLCGIPATYKSFSDPFDEHSNDHGIFLIIGIIPKHTILCAMLTNSPISSSEPALPSGVVFAEADHQFIPVYIVPKLARAGSSIRLSLYEAKYNDYHRLLQRIRWCRFINGWVPISSIIIRCSLRWSLGYWHKTFRNQLLSIVIISCSFTGGGSAPRV